METRSLELVGRIIGGDYAEIIAFDDGLCRCEADGERLFELDIFDCLVAV